jgi:hypothetical protein
MAFSRTQAGVAAGMAAGLAATIALFAWRSLPRVPADPEARIALWLACSLIAASWLLIAVGRLAGHRFFTPADIDGGGLTEGTPRAKLLQTLIQNTLEQCPARHPRLRRLAVAGARGEARAGRPVRGLLRARTAALLRRLCARRAVPGAGLHAHLLPECRPLSAAPARGGQARRFRRMSIGRCAPPDRRR